MSRTAAGPSRRELLAGVAALGAVAAAPAPRTYPLGVQFFTFTRFAAGGWDKFSEGMERAKAIGYHAIEFAGVFGHSPDRIRRRAEELGLALPSYHLGNDIVRAFTVAGAPNAIAEAQDAVYTPVGVVQVCRATLGIGRDLGCRWAGLGAVGRSNFKTMDDVRRLADAFNTCGELASRAGLKFFYHNHAIDFRPIDGKIPLDVLIDSTSPAVRYEIDTGWAAQEGGDPLGLIARHRDRIDLIHLRDADAQGRTVVPGEGVTDFAKVFAATSQLPDPIFYVEGNGRPEAEAVAEATRAYRHLTRLGWA